MAVNPLFAAYAKKTTVSVPSTPAPVAAAPVVEKPVEAVVHTPVVEKAPAPQAPVTSREVSAMGDLFSVISLEDADTASSALSALFGAAEAGANVIHPFPTCVQMRGNNGGPIMPEESSADKAVLKHLRFANDVFTAYFLTYRIKAVCYAKGKSDTPAGKADAAAKDRPMWDAIIHPSDAMSLRLVGAAGAKYGKTKKEDRVKFDGFGHIAAQVDLMFFLPEVGVFVVEGASHYKSTARTLKALESACSTFRSRANMAPGGIIGFPGMFNAVTSDEGGSTAWKCHHIDAAFDVNEDTAKLMQAFTEWSATAKSDAELRSTIEAWQKSTVSPIAKEAMEKIIAD
jgi:hypothetical protein